MGMETRSWVGGRFGSIALAAVALAACNQESPAPTQPADAEAPAIEGEGNDVGTGRGLSRDEVPLAETWDLTDVFVDDAAWRQAKDAVAARIPALAQLETRFGRSPADMLAVLTAIDEVGQDVDRVWLYATLRADQDTRDAEAQALVQQLDVLYADFGAAIAWLRPAVLALGRTKVEAWLRQHKGLAVHRRPLEEVLRQAPHTLSPEAEEVLAESSLIADGAYDIYTIFSNADLRFPTIRLSTGEEVELDQAAYTKHREAPNREDRIAVFQAFWQVYADYARTFGAMLDAGVKQDVFQARARKYDSALAAALDDADIPIAVYQHVVADAREHLPTLHRYLALRRRLLGLDQLAYYDLYVPLVKTVDLHYDYAEAEALVRQGLAPLGAEYQAVVTTALESRWIDVHPTEGKVSGGYTADVYGVHPYILLNYNGTLDDVATLAHELGHAVHSHLSDEAQPYPTAGYSTLLAEVASTTNDSLLIRSMLEGEQDPEVRLYLLGSYLETLRTTVFRQAMFADFELQIHEAVEAGEALTGERLSQLYGELLREYHGHDQGLVRIDDLYTHEWAYVPHFYYDFYVFQYVTGMVAATAISRRILAGEPEALDDYLAILRAGSSGRDVELLQRAGVDLTTSAPFEATMQEMNQLMDEIETLAPAAR
jgi:oligoendopeptidase F